MTSTRDAYGEVLVELGEAMPNLVVLDADVSKATRTAQFAKKFPDRFVNVGCAEANLIGTAAGLSLTGKVPIASTMAVFASCRALDQIRNSICYPKLNVKIVATHAGITVGEDGATHQSIEDISIMRALPNMTVVVPCDAIETKKAIRAVVKYAGPVYVRLGRDAVPDITTGDTPFEIGKALILREGNDIAIFATGIMVGTALEAAEELQQRQVSARVINLHTIKPIDEEMIIRTTKGFRAIISIEENTIIGGLGGALAEIVSREALCPLQRIGIRDTFAESGKPTELLNKYGLAVENIITVARKMLKC
jgi:transketolase